MNRLSIALFALLVTVLGLAAPAHAASTTTALTVNGNPVTGDVGLSAAIESCPRPVPEPDLTGTVQFFEGTTLVATASAARFGIGVNSCGGPFVRAQATLPGVSPGIHTYTAVYSGDAHYGPSTSVAMTVTIPARSAPLPTVTQLTLVVNSITGTIGITGAVEACPQPAGTPDLTGTVQFYEGSTLVASATVARFGIGRNSCGGSYIQGQTALINVSPGTHVYTAVYSGDAYYQGSTSSAGTAVVPPRPQPVATVTALNLFGNSVTAQVILVAAVEGCPQPTGTPDLTGTLQFFEGTTLVGSAPVARFGIGRNSCNGSFMQGQMTLTSITPGTHSYTVVYGGDTYYTGSTSPATSVTIAPPPPAAHTTTALTAFADSIRSRVALVAAVEACPRPSSNTPDLTGTVQFFEGATLVGSSPVQRFGIGTNSCGDGYRQGQITLDGMSPGTHTYTAVYGGDAYYIGSTAAAATATITPPPSPIATTLALQAHSDPITGDVSLWAPMEACPLPSAWPDATGTVQFFEGSTLVGTAPMNRFGIGRTSCNGSFMVAQLKLPAVAPGHHAYSASYGGDAFYNPSAAAAVDIDVTALPAVSPGLAFGGPTSTLTGNATLQLSGGGALCGFTRGAFVPVSGSPYSPPEGSAPPDMSFIHGLVGFTASGCTPGATLMFTLTLPPGSDPPSAYWKYGPTPDDVAPHWYRIPAVVTGNVVTFSITDGGLGDDDLTVNGTIVDAGGPAFVAAQARTRIYWYRDTGNGAVTAYWQFAKASDGRAVLAQSQFVAGLDATLSGPLTRIGPVADVTGDAIPDVVWWSSTGDVWVWSMAPDGRIAASARIANGLRPDAAPLWSLVGAGDLNGDGRADLAWQAASTGQVVVWYLAADGSIAGSHDYGVVARDWRLVGVGDVNGDGIADLIWHRSADGSVAIWIMHTDGTYTPAFPGSAGEGHWRPYKVADFDGDGKADIFWRNEADGASAVWYLDGGELSDADFLPAVPLADWTLGTATDLDLDGRADLVWYAPGGGNVVRWTMRGRHSAPVFDVLPGVEAGWKMLP